MLGACKNSITYFAQARINTPGSLILNTGTIRDASGADTWFIARSAIKTIAGFGRLSGMLPTFNHRRFNSPLLGAKAG